MFTIENQFASIDKKQIAMEEGKCFIGLEIASSKVAAIAGVLENKKVKILGFSERLVSPSDELLRYGVIENAHNTSEFISGVLDDIVSEFEKSDYVFELDSVNINITNLSVSSQARSGKVIASGGANRIRQEDVDRLVDDVKNGVKITPGNVVIHNLPRDFFVNDQKASGTLVGKIGNQLSGDFNFITTKSEYMDYLLECVNQVPAKGATGHLQVENILLNSVADTYSILNYNSDGFEEKKEGVAIVNIGAEMTEICVYHGGSLRYHNIIPIAGNAINSDLEKAFEIKFQEAELLKKVCGSIPPMLYEESPVVVIEGKFGMASKEIFLKNAMTVVEWRLREIAAIVNAELTKSGFKSNLLNGVILTGGTSHCSTIVEIFSQVCKNVNFRTPQFNSSINFNGFEQLKNPKYSTLMGLIVAPGITFDKRVDNRILTPSPILNRTPQPHTETSVNKSVKGEEKVSGGGFFKVMGEMFKKAQNDLNDDYNLQSTK